MFPLINVGSQRFPKMIPRRVVRVTWDDNITTEGWINGTEIEIQRYYLNNEFNHGNAFADVMKTATKVEFIDVEVPALVAI